MPYGLYLKRHLDNNERIHEVFLDGKRSGIRELISCFLQADQQARYTMDKALIVIQALRGK